MKKNVLIIIGLLLSFLGHSQISFEATDDFGRLQDITYDPLVPNKLYALTNAGNHILVSENNRATWEVLYSFPNADAKISRMKLLDSNTAISFMVSNTVGNIQDGVYIYNLLSNSITNYYPLPNLSDNPVIVSYDVYNSAGTHVIIHDTFSDGVIGIPVAKVFYTSDSGASWNLVYLGPDNDDVNVNNVAFNPTKPENIFIARSFSPGAVDGGLLISEDEGSTWTERLPGIVLEPIAFNPVNSDDIIVGTAIAFGTTAESLYRSLDGGVTWNSIPNNWTGGDSFYNNINKVVFNPSDTNNIIVLEENEVAVTFDGGLTWSNTVYVQDDSNTYYYGLNASYNPFTEGEIVISTPYYPQFSTNSGISLSQIQIPFYNVMSVASGLYGSEDHLYYGAQGGRIHKNMLTGNVNSFQTFNSFEFSLPKNYMITDPIIPGRVFTFSTSGFFGGSLYLSTDYGATNTVLLSNYADDIRVLTVDPNNSNVIFVSFRYGEASNVQKIDFSDLNNIIVTEITIPSSGVDNGVVTGIEISGTDSQEMYLAQKEKFYKTSDGGVTWEERINGLNLISTEVIWDMGKNPFDENHFTVATQNGIYTTTDAGLNWIQTYADGPAHKVKYSPFTPGLIAIGVKRYGSILYSLDNGVNWTKITENELKHVATQGIDFNFSGNNIDAYLATGDLGVVKYQIQNLPLSVEAPTFNENSIRIYPNPTSGIVNVVSFNNNFIINNIQIHSITGQKVFETELASFDISNLSSGIYIIKATTNEGQSISQKLVKN